MKIEENQKSFEEEVVKTSLLANKIKAVVFFLFAVSAVVLTYFFEMGFSVNFESEFDQDISISLGEDVEVGSRGVLRLNAEWTGGEPELLVVDQDSSSDEYLLSLQGGNLWGNFAYSDSVVNIIVDQVVFMPNSAQFNLSFDGERINLSVYNGDVYLGFLPEGVEIEEVQGRYSSIFLNKMLVPRDSQVEIPLSKLDERLEFLLYSKLIKEFKFSAISSVLREEVWVKDNLFKDTKSVEAYSQEFISELIQRGIEIDDSRSGQLTFWLKENFTLVPSEKEKILFDRIFGYLNDSIYYSHQGQSDLSTDLLTEFISSLAVLDIEVKSGPEFVEKFNDFVFKLRVFSPNDPVFEIYLALLNVRFDETDEKDVLLDYYWQSVYEGLSLNKIVAQESLERYYSKLDVVLEQRDLIQNFDQFIVYQNQLFDNLFLRYSTFYKDEYFAIKSVLESEMLNSLAEGQLKEELSQDLVANKINYLKRLRRFFFDGKVSVDDSKEIISRLIEEIDELMPEDGDTLAVVKLFESQLEDIGDFWGYLNSPEYFSNVYGGDHEERYEYYLSEVESIGSIFDVQSDILGEDVENDQSVEELVEELEDYFLSFSDITEIEIGEIGNVSQRYIEVKGRAVYPFEAVYDRSYDSLKELSSSGDLVSDSSIKLSNLALVLRNNFSDFEEVVDEELSDEDLSVAEESHAQRSARNYIANQVSEVGFVVTIDDVKIVDDVDAVYRINEVILDGYPNVVVTFDYDAGAENGVKNLFLEIDARPFVLKSEYTLEELKSIIMAEDDFNQIIEDDAERDEDGSLDDVEVSKSESEGDAGEEEPVLDNFFAEDEDGVDENEEPVPVE